MLTRYLTSFTLFVALILFPLSPVAASDIRFIDVASVNWTGSKAFTATVSQVESSIRDEVGPRWKRYTSFDAANAATDAANLAAEAADAATVAAEEARDAADAATAAVEALSTEVATLMAALKAQITTLANVVAKIAKKVKA